MVRAGGEIVRSASGRSAAEPNLRRRRHALVVALTFVTGCADAMGFLSLGGAFSSVMTGNMVLLGLSAGRADLALASTSAAAIASFVVGVLVGAHIAGVAKPGDPVWPTAVNQALGLEIVVFSVLLLVWELTLGGRSEHLQLGLLMLSAAALGLQSSAIQRFGVPGLSSTYLTGTLTALIGAIAARSPRAALLPKAEVLLALMTGAAVGAVVATHVPWLSPALLVVPLGAVIGLGARLPKHTRDQSASDEPRP
jgi:uncharacterized membrane protein YoaK (UPF0700 family)